MFVGQEPETVDFSDPALPPGFSADKIHAGIAVAMRQMTERGLHADLCLVQPDDTAAAAVERQLADKLYDGVVIGGGIRLPPKSLLLFEAVINAVHGRRRARSSRSTRGRKTAPMPRRGG